MGYHRIMRQRRTRWKRGGHKEVTELESTPWGPHCFLHQERHPEPFSKTTRADARRQEKKFKSNLRKEIDRDIEDC